MPLVGTLYILQKYEFEHYTKIMDIGYAKNNIKQPYRTT